MGRLSPGQPDTGWQPYCGAEFGTLTGGGQSLATIPDWHKLGTAMVAGDPVICDKPAHGSDTPHVCSELHFAWW